MTAAASTPLYFFLSGKTSCSQNNVLLLGTHTPGLLGLWIWAPSPRRAKRHRSSRELVRLRRDSPGVLPSAGRGWSGGCPALRGLLPAAPRYGEPGAPMPGTPPRPELPRVISGISGRKVACSDLPPRGTRSPGVPVPSLSTLLYCTPRRPPPSPLPASRERLPLVFTSKWLIVARRWLLMLLIRAAACSAARPVPGPAGGGGAGPGGGRAGAGLRPRL